MNHLMEFDSIRLNFGDRVILSDIFMKCATGRITGLLGRNGQGKTCLLNIVYGELQSEDKSIRFDGIQIARPCKRPELLRYLPQFNFLPGQLTLKRIFNDFELDFSEFAARFPEFAGCRNSRPGTLSGGQSRFVETYLIVKAKSQFVLLDEPFTHLMPLQIEKMLELILEERRNKGFLITDHLYRPVMHISDELYLLANGKTHFIKDPAEIESLGYARL